MEPAKQIDGKQQYQIDPPDDPLETISLADYDLFPNIKKLLVIGCISPIRSTEAQTAVSGVIIVIKIFTQRWTKYSAIH